MTGTKWTPGPWIMREYAHDGYTGCEIGVAEFTEHLGLNLGLSGIKDGRYMLVSGAIDAHDGNLIAAAPDLYEALSADEALFSAMCEILDDDALWPHVSIKVIRNRRDAARAALKKARGET